MFNAEMIEAQIAKTAEIKEVFVEILQTKAFVKKFNRKDSTRMLADDDTVSVMVFLGVVDDLGVQVFDSLDKVVHLAGPLVMELFKHVNDFNTESVEKQAKK